MRKFLNILLLLVTIYFIPLDVFAHPGRTDSSGGHTDHSTGEYHYHHGNPAHLHEDTDGDGFKECPYNSDYKKETTVFDKVFNEQNKSDEYSLSLYDIPYFVIGISVLFLLLAPFMDYLRPGLTEFVFEVSLKAVIISLPFIFLFDFLFMLFG